MRQGHGWQTLLGLAAVATCLTLTRRDPHYRKEDEFAMPTMPMLRRGSQGNLVEQWQAFLIGKGYLERGNVTGLFGPRTDAATRNYQRMRGLADDGIVGPATWAAALADTPPFPADDSAASEHGLNWPSKPPFAPLPLTPHIVRMALFGTFDFTTSDPPNVVIQGDWVQRNITSVPIPQLLLVPQVNYVPAPGHMQFHRKVAAQLQALWQAWESHGLLDRITGFEGSFNPRFVKGTNVLSNHAFGIAFDINTHENQFGAQPALVGQPGSVRELVPLANAHGFYWGGHFPAGRLDGMHFEIAKVL
jgi:hypothetical protein